MRFIKKELKNFDNKGLSLVELVCSVAILGFIGIIVSSVLVVSADSYNRGNSETKVQQEAQLVANQIDDLLIDATSKVEYVDKTLTITQGTTEHRVTFIDADGEAFPKGSLVYQEFTVGTGTPTPISEAQLMASGIKSFIVYDSEFAKYGYVKLDMTVERNSQTYPAVFTITARNRDTTTATEILAAIYLPNEVILEPWQENYELVPTTSGLTNPALNWSIEGAVDSSTALLNATSGNGKKVKVGENETVSKFMVKVTSQETAAGGSPKAQKIVNVRVRRVNNVDITGQFVAGTMYMPGATYNLKADVMGNNLTQAFGTDYDQDYVDPYQVAWTVVEGSDYIDVSANPSDSTIATVIFKAELPEGASVSVKATARHPAGVNKTGKAYGNPVEDVWTLTRFSSPFEPGDGGWLRQSSQAQARVKDSIVGLQTSVGGVRSEVFIRFKESGSSYPKNANGRDIWMPNIYGDGNDSRTVNLRPLMTGLMEYNKDYDVEIMLVIFDTEGNAVWPFNRRLDDTEDPLYDGSGRGLFPSIPDSYKKAGRLERVGLGFKSEANMLNLQPKADSEGKLHGITKNTEATAPTIIAQRDQQFVLMEKYEVLGIDTTGTSVDNAINYILEKKQPDGTWLNVTNKNPDGAGMFEVQKGSACRVTLRNQNYRGSYRVKVYIENMDNNTLASDGKTIIPGNPSKIDYILYDEESGYNIFYFNVM
ncbi:MAG: hypothetical protein NC094_07830 [Bacteroidales bacterium]|nr:hypothetical protein [Lachnoclostridium sp.]MCM1385058.1 hypothetical protein [Lachnoclostridium sp.]MCM1465310.1 hypothetical protein [Bacteroidales bacterium]